MFKNIVNLTPHAIVVRLESGEDVTIPPSGTVARVSSESVNVGEIDGIPVMRTEYGNIEGLPEPVDDTVYIVSTLVLLALKDKGIVRNDIVSPNTSPASVVRDADGRVVGVKSFQVL